MIVRSTLFLAALATLAAQTTPAPRTQLAGTVSAVDAAGHKLSFKTDQGQSVTVDTSDRTVIIHIPVGETDVRKGTKVAFDTLQPGDRVVAIVRTEGSVRTATSLIVRTKAELADTRQKELEDWKKRGTAGNVAEIDAPGKALTVRAGGRTLKIQTSDATKFHRYALDSAKNSDATPSTFAAIKTGDQVHVLGNRSEDGLSVAAEQVYSGSFRQIAATIVAIDAATGELKVTDLATKKPLTIRVTSDSTLKKLPEEAAQGLARRYQGTRNAGGPGPSGGRGGDIGAMLDRLPPVPLTELKPKDAIMVSTTQGSDPGKATAIMLLAGVEPILTAAPTATRDIMSGWNLGGGGEGQ